MTTTYHGHTLGMPPEVCVCAANGGTRDRTVRGLRLTCVRLLMARTASSSEVSIGRKHQGALN